MLPIYLGLQTFAKNKANTCVRVMCDNTTVVNVLMGTSHFDSCNSIAKDIWEWCVARNMWLSIAHIPHKQNLVAEFESETGANFLQSKDGPTTTTQSSKGLALKDLTLKLTMLLCLTTGQRGQTIHKIDILKLHTGFRGPVPYNYPGETETDQTR